MIYSTFLGGSDWGQWTPLLLTLNTAFYVASQPAGSPPPALADNSAELRALWTAADLYFAVFVRDDAIVDDSPDVWRDDEIELAFVGAWDGNPAGGDTHQYTVNADGRITDFGNPAIPVSIQAAAVPAAGGWNVEVRIPASHLFGFTAPLAAGKVMPFDLGLQDDDGGNWDSHMQPRRPARRQQRARLRRRLRRRPPRRRSCAIATCRSSSAIEMRGELG